MGNRKYNLEYVREYMNKFGYELLSTEYIGTNHKLLVKCPKNHIYEVTFGNFKTKGNRCRKCTRMKYNIEDIKSITLEINSQIECISTEYNNNLEKLTFKCVYGHIFKRSWSCFKQYSTCPICKKNFNGLEISKGKLRKRFYRNRDWLYNKYINELKSSKEIGKICNVGHRVILNWLKKFDIPIRNSSISTSIGQIQHNNKRVILNKARDGYKICIKCCKEKKITEFRKASKNPDGLQTYCKDCMKSLIPKTNGWRKYTKEELKRLESYRDTVVRLSNHNYNKFLHYINPLGLSRGFKEFTLDHIYSVQDGFENNVPIEIIASPVNLRMIRLEDNISKGRKSLFELDQLIELHNQFFREVSNVH